MLVSPWASAQSVPAIPIDSENLSHYAITCVDAEALVQRTPDGTPLNPVCAEISCAEFESAAEREGDTMAITKECASSLGAQDSRPAIRYQGNAAQLHGSDNGLHHQILSYHPVTWSCISINGQLCPPHLYGGDYNLLGLSHKSLIVCV